MRVFLCQATYVFDASCVCLCLSHKLLRVYFFAVPSCLIASQRARMAWMDRKTEGAIVMCCTSCHSSCWWVLLLPRGTGTEGTEGTEETGETRQQEYYLICV